MIDKIIDIYKVSSWPPDVLQYFSTIQEVLNNYCNNSLNYAEQIANAKEYDKAIEGLKPVLSSYYLRGYHCTRLTKHEISSIVANGMTLQDGRSLKDRIDALICGHILEQGVAVQLLEHNQADDDNRKNMLWFCFFSPHKAGKGGIERFFRS